MNSLEGRCSDEGGENEDGRRGVRFLEDGGEWRLPGLLYADDLILCGEEDLRVIVGRFAEVCRRGGLKFNTGNSHMMLLNGEE